MSDERDKEFLTSLDRRVSDLDAKVSNMQRDYQRDYTELSHDIKENTARVNNGLSPSIQKALQDNSDNKLLITTHGNTLEKTMVEMKSIVRETTDLTKLMISNFEQNKLKPVEEEVGLMKKTVIYGLVGAVIVFMGQKGMNLIWDKVVKVQDKAAIVEPVIPVRQKK